MSNIINESESYKEFTVNVEQSGQRIDKFVSQLLPDFSRSQIQAWIKEQQITVNQKSCKQTYKVEDGDIVAVTITQQEEYDDWIPEDIPLNIIYEDESVIVINKPAGLVVHPGAGNHSGTLLNAVLHHAPETASLARAGIVHRLDKDTSGVMVVAKQENARLRLTEQLADRTISRKYIALCLGNLISGGTIDKRMNRDRHDRRKMRVVGDHEQGKNAITHYRIMERYRRHTLLSVKLETGRTHQIRVHLTSAGYPLVGDPTYGKRLVLPKRCSADLEISLRGFKRQALHAQELAFIHPNTGELCSFHSELPDDMRILCAKLAQDTEQNVT